MEAYPQEDDSGYLYVGECLLEGSLLQETEKYICFKRGRIYRVSDYAEARIILENKEIQAVIVDQYLSAGNGIEFMRWLHALVDIPVIGVIMSRQTVDVIVALEAGAADAVFPDISVRELVARIGAAVRKHSVYPIKAVGGDALQPRHEPGSALGHRIPLYFSIDKRRLYFSDSSRASLHGKEADLLQILIGKYPEYVQREKISQALFERSWHPSDRGVDNLVSRLRKVIDGPDSLPTDSIIETIRNEGYRLRQPVALIDIGDPPSGGKSNLEALIK